MCVVTCGCEGEGTEPEHNLGQNNCKVGVKVRVDMGFKSKLIDVAKIKLKRESKYTDTLPKILSDISSCC